MSDSTIDEATWWQRARDGDGEAMGRIFDLHHQRVYANALRDLRDPHAAEDATAVAFLELWTRRSAVRVVNGSVLPWLLVTTTNACRNIARSTRRYRNLIQALPRQATARSAEEEAELTVDFRSQSASGDLVGTDYLDPELAQALRSLPKSTRELMVLTALEGYSVGEAAQATGMTVGAARTRLSRARAQMREELLLLPNMSNRVEAHHD